MIEDLIERLRAGGRRPRLDVDTARAIADEAFRRGFFVRSMETYELIDEHRSSLRVDLSILGLEKDWDTRASRDPAYARAVLEEKLDAAAACPNRTEFDIWLDDFELKP